MKVKYYYSAVQQIRMGYFVADAEGKPIFQFEDSKYIKTLPRVTICSILKDNKLYFGYATCASKDEYRRSIGRQIAYARAIGKPFAVVDVPDMKDIHEISDSVIDKIFELETKRIYKCTK